MDPGAVPGASTKKYKAILWGQNRIDVRNKELSCVRQISRKNQFKINANDNSVALAKAA